MNTQRYQFCLNGLQEKEGQIRAASLRRVLDALIQTAERTTRLLATGEGSGKGKKPRWLDATVDFTITGLESGSTVLDIEAPRLGETPYAEFAQRDFGREGPSPDDTVLDLAARAVKEVQTRDPAGDYFDGSVLEAILKFRKAAGVAGVRYDLLPRDGAHEGFTLDDSVCAHVSQRLNDILVPRAFIVSGRLDEIKHGGGRFRLLVSQGSQLLGRLDTMALNVETLRPLWGKQATVEGMVHFKVNGQPRFIEARRIGSRRHGDDVWDEMPSVEVPESRGLTAWKKHARSANFMELWGAWPGDEPIEELLDQLD